MGTSGSGPRLVLGLLTAVLAAGSGCSRDPSPGGPDVLDQSDTLSFLYPAEPLSLDPSASLDIYSAVILDHVFERLVRLGPTGEVVPGAAAGWSVSSDGTVYTFHLRADGRWSDGKPVTAGDFRASWLRVLDPRARFGNAASLTPYIRGADGYSKGQVPAEAVGIRAADDRTLVVELNGPTPFFLRVITYWCFSPLRVEALARAGSHWDKSPGTYLSNGPYRLEEYQRGDHILMSRNPYYWNRSQVHIPGIKVLFQRPGQDPYQLFREGTLDCVFNVQAAEMKALPDLKPNLHIDQALGTQFILVNHQNPVLDRPEFRKALAESVDRQKIVDEAVNAAGTPSRYFVPSSLVMAGENFHDFTTLNSPPDKVLAASLVKDLVRRGVDLSKPLRLYYRLSPENAKTAQLLAASWHQTLGIRVEPEGLEWPRLFSRCLQGDYDLALMAYSALYPHPMAFIGLFLPNGTATSLTHWSDPEFQGRILAALDIQDERGSLGALRSLEAQLVDDHHILPLYHIKVICLMSDRVVGWYRNGMSGFHFEDASLRAR